MDISLTRFMADYPHFTRYGIWGKLIHRFNCNLSLYNINSTILAIRYTPQSAITIHRVEWRY
jgi:hypothetical protein